MLAQYIEGGQMKAEYVRVEGEHSALTGLYCGFYCRRQSFHGHKRQRPPVYA